MGGGASRVPAPYDGSPRVVPLSRRANGVESLEGVSHSHRVYSDGLRINPCNPSQNQRRA